MRFPPAARRSCQCADPRSCGSASRARVGVPPASGWPPRHLRIPPDPPRRLCAVGDRRDGLREGGLSRLYGEEGEMWGEGGADKRFLFFVRRRRRRRRRRRGE